MSIEVTVDGDRFKRKAKNFERRYNVLQKRKIEHWLIQLRDRVRLGDFFDNPTPNLQTQVWAGTAKKVGNTIEGSAGWGTGYGPILEFGVTAKNQGGWWIRPKKQRPGGSKTPKEKRRLHFMAGGVMRFAKEVFHPWKYGTKGSRPHWEPELNKMRSKIEKDLAATVDEAMK